MLYLNDYKKHFTFGKSLTINDFATWHSVDEVAFKVFKKTKLVSAVQVLTDKGNILSFESIKSRRVWQTAEINYLIIICGLIETLLKYE